MLIRFQVRNFLSFKEETEFNLVPSRISRLKHHKYEINDIELLKMSAIYGANGSGKSNLIKSIDTIKKIVKNEKGILGYIQSRKFKLEKEYLNKSVEFGIEIYTNSTFYYYSVEVNNGVIISESLSKYASSKDDEKIVFLRTLNDGDYSIKFSEEFYKISENTVLQNLIQKDLLKSDQSLIGLLDTLTNDAFEDSKAVMKWFVINLIIIYPNTNAKSIPNFIDSEPFNSKFADSTIASLNTGIKKIRVDCRDVADFFGTELHEKIAQAIDEVSNDLSGKKFKIVMNRSTKQNITIFKQEEEVLAKTIYFEHEDSDKEMIEFKPFEESYGSLRLVDYLPALYLMEYTEATILIDEIERSIHPNTIKEIITKFSNNDETFGQLIFTTHESNLLDQNILRTDEIWFTEKENSGATKLYPLSDFKEHSTIDIQKGYLMGRYGAIPFLGNFRDLNWEE